MPSETALRFDPAALAKYGRLALVARNLVVGFLTGVHKSPYKGFSVEFAEHRQYYPGDEIRHIDWRAYGKTDRYYIKEYEEETNLKAHLLVDASGSMAYRGQAPSKFEHAQYIAASLAYLMLHQRDAVGLALHDTKVRQMIPPRANAKHLLQLIRALQEKRLAAAGLDVTQVEPLPATSPLWAMPNVLITPHTAGETQRYEDGVIDLLLANLERQWRGETTLENEVV